MSLLSCFMNSGTTANIALFQNKLLLGETNQDGTLNTTTTYQMLFGGTAVGPDNATINFTSRNNQNFWLASGCANADDGDVGWGLRNVVGANVLHYYLYGSGGGEYDSSYGVRPVVSLKSNVQLEPNGDNNWKIK